METTAKPTTFYTEENDLLDMLVDYIEDLLYL
jgi:hypothetical protein